MSANPVRVDPVLPARQWFREAAAVEPLVLSATSGIVNVITVHMSGDVGGAGIARFHGLNSSTLPFSGSDANTAAAAVMAMWSGLHTYLASDVTYTCDPAVQYLDIATGAPFGSGTISSVPAPVTSIGSGAYAAGSGARGYWHTNAVHGRRLVRGATFFTPMVQAAYLTNGALGGTVASTVVSSMGSYANAMTTASLTAAIYCRPKPITAGNGFAAGISAWSCSTTVAALRSRRS